MSNEGSVLKECNELTDGMELSGVEKEYIRFAFFAGNANMASKIVKVIEASKSGRAFHCGELIESLNECLLIVRNELEEEVLK